MSLAGQVIYELLAEEAGYPLSRPAQQPVHATNDCGERNAKSALVAPDYRSVGPMQQAPAEPTKAWTPGGKLFA